MSHPEAKKSVKESKSQPRNWHATPERFELSHVNVTAMYLDQ